MPRPAIAALTVLCAAVCACGGAGATTATVCSTRPGTPIAAASAAVGAVRVVADRGLVEPGKSVRFSVRVRGPVTLHAACDGPVELVVIDTADLHVFSDTPAALRGTVCGDVTLADGQTADYGLRWTPDVTLPSGTYTVEVTVGDQPPITVPVVLGHRAGESCSAGAVGGL